MAALDRRALVPALALSLALALPLVLELRTAAAPSPALVARAPRAAASLPASAASAARAPAKLVPDHDLGALLARLSEKAGGFPSDNYVTNETSLLHVARALGEPKLHGRAYVGVGPEQSYTYLAMLEPRVAYIVDIRRGNLLEHMLFRGCFEVAETRLAFLSALLMRHPRAGPETRSRGATQAAGFAELAARFRDVPPSAALRQAALARTAEVMNRLRVARSPSDDGALARIHDAFATHGLAIKYAMLGNGRVYPTLGDNFAVTDAESGATSFLGSEESYARVRRLVIGNRVLPVVGDFGGQHALRAVAADMRARGEKLGVFYCSNVEQYLFGANTYGRFVASVAAMPRDEESRLVRVWFDAGRPHPAQRPGHRTTQLSVRASAFVRRAEARPFRSYWEVVNETDEPAPP